MLFIPPSKKTTIKNKRLVITLMLYIPILIICFVIVSLISSSWHYPFMIHNIFIFGLWILTLLGAAEGEDMANRTFTSFVLMMFVVGLLLWHLVLMGQREGVGVFGHLSRCGTTSCSSYPTVANHNIISNPFGTTSSALDIYKPAMMCPSRTCKWASDNGVEATRYHLNEQGGLGDPGGTYLSRRVEDFNGNMGIGVSYYIEGVSQFTSLCPGVLPTGEGLPICSRCSYDVIGCKGLLPRWQCDYICSDSSQLVFVVWYALVLFGMFTTTLLVLISEQPAKRA